MKPIRTLLPFCFAFALSLTSAVALESDEKIRIGVYDSRAIAIAFAPSRYNPVKEQMKKFGEAKAEGDKQAMEELEKWGRKHQRQLHRQGFSFVPVDDLLSHVKGGVADVARNAEVIAIVRKCDYIAQNVEVVDVTDELVELFDPSQKTLEFVRSIKGKPAIDLDDVEKHNKSDDH